MSFFQTKKIIVKIRGKSIEFEAITQGDMAKLEYYGKPNVNNEEGWGAKALGEIAELLSSKSLKVDGEEVKLPEDAALELTSDELVAVLEKVADSSETNKRNAARR